MWHFYPILCLAKTKSNSYPVPLPTAIWWQLTDSTPSQTAGRVKQKGKKTKNTLTHRSSPHWLSHSLKKEKKTKRKRKKTSSSSFSDETFSCSLHLHHTKTFRLLPQAPTPSSAVNGTQIPLLFSFFRRASYLLWQPLETHLNHHKPSLRICPPPRNHHNHPPVHPPHTLATTMIPQQQYCATQYVFFLLA